MRRAHGGIRGGGLALMKVTSILGYGKGEVSLNLTAMIDVVFILITFFMLIFRSIGQENYKLSLPTGCPAAVIPEQQDDSGVTVSVFRPTQASETAGQAAPVVYAVRREIFDPTSEAYRDQPGDLVADMADQIARQVGRRSDDLVHLRADKDMTYGQVQQVLLALSRARVKTVQLAAYREQSSPPSEGSSP